MTDRSIQFDTAFAALTDYSPFGWQQRFFDQLSSGSEVPRVCELPTGLGKTSVIPIWLIALARQAEGGTVTLPRRCVYIVNRRTVVDQATGVVQQIRERLLAPNDSRWSKHEDPLRALSLALRRLAPTGELMLAISTLRGELADNQEWKADPARPAIIIGTIDMVGSKLLFSGYGDGNYWRAQHAGLVGQDSLIVHDEAHLTPAFGDLLHYLAEAQCRASEPRPVQVMDLSATPRPGYGPTLKLEPGEEKNQVVRRRLDATKHLHLHEVEADSEEKHSDVHGKALAKLVGLSLKHKDAQAKVLIYVRSPEDAQKVLRELNVHLGQPAKERVALLTGTIRGHERDQLVRTYPMRAFLDHNSAVAQTVYLVSTSAGEVGVDMDADHMVCDLATLDSMIQRLGRVNRGGGHGREARVDVVIQSGGQDKTGRRRELEEAIEATRAILENWAVKSGGPIDVSPRGLRAFLSDLDSDSREKAFAPKPVAPLLTDILLDTWALTSVSKQIPGRPEVAPYLHGLTNDPPETYVAWRKELVLLDEARAHQDTLGRWFQACRIHSGECLRDRTDRVKKTLQALLKAHRQRDRSCDFPIVLLNERGEAVLSRLSSVVEDGLTLEYRTIVLPVEACGLSDEGMLNAEALDQACDVAEATVAAGNERRRERWLMIRDADGERYTRLISGESAESFPTHLRESRRVTLEQAPEHAEGRGHGRYLLLMVHPAESSLEDAEAAKTRQTLIYHEQRTANHMRRTADALGLKEELKDALVTAAKWHDRGKARPVWQHYASNTDLGTPLAKSTGYLDGRALGGYRHEFGSLLEARADVEIRNHAELHLIWHLIACHHGWARPHFERNAWDNTRTTAENEEAALEVLQRFGQLQSRYGRWGLAWLEALLRCADIAASSETQQPAGVQEET